MKPIIKIISERISQAIAKATSQNVPAIVTPATDPKFGDYQSNNALALAKQLKANPRQLAEKIIANLQIDDICEKPEIAGAGFINLRLKPDFITDSLCKINTDENLGIEKAIKPETIVVDFSGPNIAKQMHVGHLRSTIIGDSICRMLELQGHKVIRQNHIGDWGTALGKVILGLWHMCMDEKKHGGKLYYINELKELKTYAENKEKLKAICQRICERHEKDWEDDYLYKRGDGKKYFGPFLDELNDPEKRDKDELWDKITILYQYVNLLEESLTPSQLMIPSRKKKKIYKDGEEPFDCISIPYDLLSRHITAMLQNIDDEDNKQEKDAWKLITKISLEHCETIYDRLNVKITDKYFDYPVVRGESFYRNMLGGTVTDLKNAGIAAESDGAICVFPEGFKTKEGKPMPFIIQKSDGAFLYATFDLAAIRYRVNELKADRIIYVTDARQALHFRMLAVTVLMADWVRDDTRISHLMFGSVLGEDGKPLKTRSGENVKLKELLDEAVKRAKAVVEEKNPELDSNEKEKIAQAVGIGAVKYSDYSNNRTSDYIFSFDKMLAMDGNTAPYMQYAYARVKSIGRKGSEKGIDTEKELKSIKEICLNAPAEFELAKQLIRYNEAFNSAIGDLRPNFLTSYLYELAQKFSAFYNACPVLDADENTRPSRLLLCELTARTIRHGLENLLGIDVLEQM